MKKSFNHKNFWGKIPKINQVHLNYNRLFKTVQNQKPQTTQVQQKRNYCDISKELSFEELKKINIVFKKFLDVPISKKDFINFMRNNCDYNDLKSMSLVLHEIISQGTIEEKYINKLTVEVYKTFILSFIGITIEKNNIPAEESIKTLRMIIKEVALDLNLKWPIIVFENLIKR